MGLPETVDVSTNAVSRLYALVFVAPATDLPAVPVALVQVRLTAVMAVPVVFQNRPEWPELPGVEPGQARVVQAAQIKVMALSVAMALQVCRDRSVRQVSLSEHSLPVDI
jgi:hypothetical protein